MTEYNNKQKETQHTVLKENSIAELPVVRKSSFGVFLSGGTGNSSDDILLHNGQQTGPIDVGDTVRVFLYHDPRHRLTASMRLPKLSIGGIGYAEVLLTTRFGAFVDLGTERGIFLPFSEMMAPVQKGQKIWVKLYLDKTGRLSTTTYVDEEMRRIAIPCTERKEGDIVTGTVYNITRQGAFLITRERWIGFLHQSDFPKLLTLGQKLSGRITFIRKDGHFNILLRPQKEIAMDDDMDILLEHLQKHGGVLPYTDKSEPAIIKANLGISKSAFKRAVGHLLKTNKIKMHEGKIKLN